LLEYNRWIAAGYRIRWDIAPDQGHGRDGGIPADRDAFLNAAIRANPHVFFDRDRPVFDVRWIVPVLGVYTVKIVVADAALCEDAAASYGDPLFAAETRSVEEDPIADFDGCVRIIGEGSNSHGNDHVVPQHYPARSADDQLAVEDEVPPNGNARPEQTAPERETSSPRPRADRLPCGNRIFHAPDELLACRSRHISLNPGARPGFVI